MPPGFNSDSDLESVLSVQLKQGHKLRRNSAGTKYICSHEGCKETFKRLDHLDRHEFKHTGVRKHACHYENCDKSYTILTHLKRHIRNTHERKTLEPVKNIPCELDTCDKLFTSLTNMHRHVREVHENPKIYKCQHCDAKFKQKAKMRRHEISQHTGLYPFNCDKCSKGFYQEWNWRKHTDTCKIYVCGTCHVLFDKWSLFQKHCKETKHSHHCYQCEYCPRIYVKPVDLSNHVAAKHLNEREDKTVGEFKCDYENCQRSYAYEKNLKQHVLTAHQGKRFKCTHLKCAKVFSSAQNLQKHFDRDHNKEKGKIHQKVPNTIKRKRRKDAGISKVSHLTKLTGLIVDKQLNEELRQRQSDAIEMVTETLSQQPIDKFETDS